MLVTMANGLNHNFGKRIRRACLQDEILCDRVHWGQRSLRPEQHKPNCLITITNQTQHRIPRLSRLPGSVRRGLGRYVKLVTMAFAARSPPGAGGLNRVRTNSDTRTACFCTIPAKRSLGHFPSKMHCREGLRRNRATSRIDKNGFDPRMRCHCT